MQITNFLKHHYRHFNAAALIDAADGYNKHLAEGGKMMITLAGAMSTAEMGIQLAELIRQDKVQIISCTGANLEEDIFNLVAHDFYERVPHYRDLTPADEHELLKRHMNRVTDTCIPEEEAMRRIEHTVLKFWEQADKAGEAYFPHEFFYQILKSGELEQCYQIDPKDSWMLAAAEKNLPIICPGWEDSTLGNIYAGHVISGDIKNVHTMKTGIQYMMYLLTGTLTRPPRKARLASSRLAVVSPATSRFAWCPCCTRTCSATRCRCGATSARFRTRPPATAATRAPCPTRKSRGASWARRRRNSLLKATRPSWPH